VVRASYRRALDLTPGAAKSDFAYAGPKPLSKEAAVVMLADVVETATTRDLAAEVSLDIAVIEVAVRRVIGEVLADGQLDRTELTLLDLERIVREFVIVLEDRWIRRGRLTLSQLPRVPSAQMVRPPLGGPLN
jgi:membrane-associated HD superfamily phosphohydrolase